jgi:curved DNA-binding protein CbpA
MLRMPERDYYEVLGVPPNATDEQIRRRFRELARKYHPDVNRSPDAERLFKEITEAYRVLTSPSLRADYDLMRHRAHQARTGSGRTASSTPPPRSRPASQPHAQQRRTTADFSSTYTSTRSAELEVQQLLQSAMLAYARGSLHEAASLAKRVLRLNRHNAQAYEILGDVYRQERRIEEAIAMFTCALQCNPRLESAQAKLDALLRQRYFYGTDPPRRSQAIHARYGLVLGWTVVLMMVLAPWYMGLQADGAFQGIGFISRWSMALVLIMFTAGVLAGALLALGDAVEPMAQVMWWPARAGLPQARLAAGGLLGVLGLFAFYAAAFLYLLIAATQSAFHRTLNRVVGAVVGLTLGFLLSYAPGREQVALFAPNLLWFGVLCGWAFGDSIRAQRVRR